MCLKNTDFTSNSSLLRLHLQGQKLRQARMKQETFAFFINFTNAEMQIIRVFLSYTSINLY
jgi:uncharacterized protein YjbI with pentapeptide repeats